MLSLIRPHGWLAVSRPANVEPVWVVALLTGFLLCGRAAAFATPWGLLPQLEGDWDHAPELGARMWAAVQSTGLCNEFGPVCDFAERRTELARATLRKVRQKLEKTNWEDDVFDGAIPVLGFAVAFDPQRYSLRLLRSIDHPVRRLIMVVSGFLKNGSSIIREARQIRPDVEIIRAEANLGCAGGWNEVVHATPDEPWWLMTSNDVAYVPGELKRIAEVTAAALRNERDSILRGDSRPSYAPGVRTFQERGQVIYPFTFATFTLTRRVVATTGLFDENFWPAYAEDEDYFVRMDLLGGEGVGAHKAHYASIEYIHGPEDWSPDLHFSGTEQITPEVEMAGIAEEENGRSELAKLIPHKELPVAEQLLHANNWHSHFCRKYGPYGRPGNCRDVQYGDLGPFGSYTDWDDWVLDPWRRVCSMVGFQNCVYDVRRLVPWTAMLEEVPTKEQIDATRLMMAPAS